MTKLRRLHCVKQLHVHMYCNILSLIL